MSKEQAHPLLVSLMFCLNTEQGHIYTYNRSLGQAVRSLRWEHTAAVRAAAQIQSIPSNWELCLGNRVTRFNNGLPAKAEKMLRLVTTLRTFLQAKSLTESRPVVLFLEWFDPIHLIALCLALLGVRDRKRFAVWILYRLGIHGRSNVLFFRSIHMVIRALLGSKGLTLLSDSNIVAGTIKATMGQSVHVVPIPHGSLRDDELIETPPPSIFPNSDGRLTCWWPGQPVREKGLAAIAQMVGSTDRAARRLRIVAAKASSLVSTPNGCEVILIQNVLTRPQYVGWLCASDVILLPYNPAAYAERTSGIFCEAISAGKLAVVTDGTWMAHELRHHDLPELIMNWDSDSLADRLLQLKADPAVRSKLGRMQMKYKTYHTEPGLALALKRIYEETMLLSGAQE